MNQYVIEVETDDPEAMDRILTALEPLTVRLKGDKNIRVYDCDGDVYDEWS